MRSRVIPGSLVTIERRVPVSRLKIVDFPTFGRPTITTDGSVSVIGRHNEPQVRGSGASTVSYRTPKQKARSLHSRLYGSVNRNEVLKRDCATHRTTKKTKTSYRSNCESGQGC